MAGAVDLFAGAQSIHGANLFQVDKSPLEQLEGGVEGVIGKQASLTGSSIITSFESILRALLGFDPLDEFLQIGSELLGTTLNLSTYFGNLEDFLGQLNPLDPNFDPIAAAVSFIENVLNPTGLLASIESIANAIIEVITGAAGGLFGIGGLGSIFDDLLGLLGNPTGLGSGSVGIPGLDSIPLLGGIASFAEAAIQEVIDVLFGGLTGSHNTGNPLSILGIALGQLRADADAAIEMSTQAWSQAEQLGSTVIQLVEDEAEAVIRSPLTFVQQFLTSIGNWLGQTHQSNSPNNPAVTALAGRQAALEAAVLHGSSTTGFNDHLNRATLGTDYVLLGSDSPTMIYDGGDDGYLLGGANICGVHITPSVLPMVTDRNRFQWSIRGFESFGHTGRHRILICGNSTFTNYLAVEVFHTGYADRVRLYSVTGGTWQSTGTQQTNWTPAHRFKEWDTFDIAYDPLTNTFFLYYNSNPADFWEDSTNIISHGSGHREVAVVLNIDDDSGAVGLGVDDLSIWDYPVTA